MRDLIFWKPHQMALGHEQIDDEHRLLFDMINRLNRDLEEGVKGTALKQDTDKMIQLTRQHFHTESPFVARLPEAERRLHTLHHKHFLESLNAFQRDLETLSLSELKDRLAQLADWYLKHILEYDSLLPSDD